MDMETKKSEPVVRKVTLIEVRENQQRLIPSPRKDVRHPGQQWQMPESTSGVSTGKGSLGIAAKKLLVACRKCW